MRTTCFILVAVAGCVQTERIAPAVTAVARGDGVPVTPPLLICDTLDASSRARNVVVLGHGFVPDVTAKGLALPTVQLVGAQGGSLQPLNDMQPLTDSRFELALVGMPADGTYDLAVHSADGADTATLPGALRIYSGAPVTAFAPDHLCATASGSIQFTGTFQLPVQVTVPSYSVPLTQTQSDATHVTVNVPAYANSGSSYDFSIQDGTGCITHVAVPESCP